MAKHRRKPEDSAEKPGDEGKPPQKAKTTKPKPKQFDATFKDLAQQRPVDVLSALDAPPNAPVELLNVDLSTVSTMADVVFGIGDPLREIVHMDAQAGPDAELHRNVLAYNALLHRAYKVPIHSIVVLLRRKAQHPNLTGDVSYSIRPGKGMGFGYDIVPMWDLPAEAFLAGPLGAVPLAPLGKLPEGLSEEEGLALVIQRVVERLLRDASGGEAKRLVSAAYLLTGLRIDRQDAIRLFKGANAMRESDTFQGILEEGREEGRVEGVHRTLFRLGRKRFGVPDEATRQRVLAITDLDRLDRLADRVLDVSTWQELLETP